MMDGDQGAINKLEHALADAATGNFSGAGTELSAAGHDIKVWVDNRLAGAPPWIHGAVIKLETLATTIGEQALSDASKEVIANGLTTAAFIATAKDLMAQLPADLAATLQDVFSVLNAKVSSVTSVTEKELDAPNAEPPAGAQVII